MPKTQKLAKPADDGTIVELYAVDRQNLTISRVRGKVRSSSGRNGGWYLMVPIEPKYAFSNSIDWLRSQDLAKSKEEAIELVKAVANAKISKLEKKAKKMLEVDIPQIKSLQFDTAIDHSSLTYQYPDERIQADR